MRCQELTISRGTKVLLDKADASLPNQSICAIIGRNGTGKSSFFAAILHQLPIDHGDILISSAHDVAALSQQLPDPTLTPLQFVCAGDQRWVAIMMKIEQAEQSGDGDALAHAYGDLETIDGYTLESRAATILQGLGFNQENIARPLGEFSGGWQMRAQLARVLIAPSNILLLDEPTNHLDLESVTYLENWLQSYPGLALIISHDRAFLDTVSTHTLHLAQQQLKLYMGNYSSFARQFQEALALQGKMAKKVEQKRAHMQSFVDRFRAKASKAKQAQGRLKALEKLQFSETLEDERAFHFSFLPTTPAAYPMIKMQADCGYNNKSILTNVNITLSPDDRLGIIGVNGAGKSTFLKSLAKQIPLISGSVTHATGLSIGFYTQEAVELLNKSETPIEWMQSLFKGMPLQAIVSHLGKFHFTFDQMHQTINHFSGGECARLILSGIVLQKPQLLILDEPTNHLDMPMREALIEALQAYEGAVLLVSHDRHLLECVADQFLIVANGTVHPYNGSLDDYAKLVLQQLEKPAAKTKKTEKKKKSNTTTATNQAKQIAKLEQQIEDLEKKIGTIDHTLNTLMHDHQKNQEEIEQLSQQRQQLNTQLNDLQDKWLALADE